MAQTIVAPYRTQYRLPESDRIKIRALGENPDAEIPLEQLQEVERQRLEFVKKNGRDYLFS